MSRTMNTVRRLVLRKGGKHITLVTYGMFGNKSKVKTIPVNHVSTTVKKNNIIHWYIIMETYTLFYYVFKNV